MTTTKMLTRFSDDHVTAMTLGSWMFWLALFVATLTVGPQAQAAVTCDKTITAEVVVFDNPTVFNRLGAQNPNWITYALRRDVVYVDWNNPGDKDHLRPLTHPAFSKSDDELLGHVELRPDKRPRPLVLRSVAGSCLNIKFQNLLAPVANPNNPTQGNLGNNDQVAGRCAGIHAQGVELLNVTGNGAANPMDNDGSMVGNNNPYDNVLLNCAKYSKAGGLVGPGGTIDYHLYTPEEGAFIFNNQGAQLGSEASAGNTSVGMFGALNVEPKGARIYRSQVTEEEMRLATRNKTDAYGNVVKDADGNPVKLLTPNQCVGTSGPGNYHGVDCDLGGQPVVNYEATYPATTTLADGSVVESVWAKEGKAGLPVLNMLNGNELVHSDINAIIAGPCTNGTWDCTLNTPDAPYPLERKGFNNPPLPNRLEAFREFTSQFHDEQTNSQVFPRWYNDPVLGFTLAGVKDQFMINYGVGGIGSEIIANRLHAGPMHDCTDCAYEEFFLSSSTVGDPALLVNYPANTNIEQCDPHAIAKFNTDGTLAADQSCWRNPVNLANGPVAFPEYNDDGTIKVDLETGLAVMTPADNYALYQEDPSNVHHSYIGDFTKIRNTHAGSFEQHIFHLHNHQWLFNPNDDNANYLDAQEIMPGSGHTYELVNGGVGNRNKTSGDAIFHCHFYPHFAQGMWYHIRIMDVFEKGTLLSVSVKDDNDGDGFHDTQWALRSGKPAPGSRAHADGELPDGIPIPAIVPLPGKAMAPMPADVQVAAVDRGGFSLLGGRTPPDNIPDSSQAFVNWNSVRGADNTPGTPDDVSPGYPFTIAGYECGFEYHPDGTKTPANAATGFCPQGVVGQRFPTPPLDMLTEAGARNLAGGDWDKGLWGHVDVSQAGGFNGGLPRHALLGYTSGGFSKDTQNRLDFQKVVELARPVYYPEIGTELEHVQMRWHSERMRPSQAMLPDGTTKPAQFVMNGSKPVPGGPFQDPCIDDNGTMLGLKNADGSSAAGKWFDGDGDPGTLGTTGYSDFDGFNPRTYRVANIQIDAVFNKVGYHYPQERIISLWGDVDDHIAKRRPPEPLVMRFNTFDCGKVLHANLVPHEYEIDDFQVRTPTDIIGQHIHLPKWDLTTGDGAANGWNYEDGALAPGMVRERIKAINEFNHFAGQTTTVGELHCEPDGNGGKTCPLADHPLAATRINLSDAKKVLTIPSGDVGADTNVAPWSDHLAPVAHPYFGKSSNPQAMQDLYLGARTVIQRILIDPVVNVDGVDRGLGLTFSHDHYGPSTFQQIGLYSTILAEPAGSKWKHNETGDPLYGRTVAADDCTVNCTDGGPTTWQAAILPPTLAPEGSSVRSEEIPAHREFYFEMSDFQHAYEPGAYFGADENGVPMDHPVVQNDPFNATDAEAPELRESWKQAVNPPLKLKSVPFPDVVTAGDTCPGPVDQDNDGNFDRDAHGNLIATNASPFVPRPCVEAINISHSSMWVVNYRNEPVGLRVFDPDRPGPDKQDGAQALGDKGDLALAFQSRTDREIPQLNTSLGNTPYPTPDHCQNGNGDGINCDRNPGDPFTPIIRAYEWDNIKVKAQVGATEEQHQMSFHGLKWLSNGSGFGRAPNSGWRNFQSHGISEQFSLQIPIIPDRSQRGATVDYLYLQDGTRDGVWTGTWGLIRSYKNRRSDLYVLPSNDVTLGDIKLSDEGSFKGVCPASAPPRTYQVAAVLANKVLDNKLNVTIPALTDLDPQFPTKTFGDQTVGGPLNPDGGTLVYNRRGTDVQGMTSVEGGELLRGGQGPLNDPTAMMYVRLEDLVPRWIDGVSPDGTEGVDNSSSSPFPADNIDDRCQKFKADGSYNLTPVDPECPLTLRQDDPLTAENEAAPVEPLVIRANAGDCIEVTLHNKLVDQARALRVGEDPYVAGVASSSPTIWYDDNGVTKSLFDRVMAEKLILQGKTFKTADNMPVDIDQIVFDEIPDLAGWQDLFWVVNRHMMDGNGQFVPVGERRGMKPEDPTHQMHFFGNNLIAPSAHVGLHAQLVEYDASRDDGLAVGANAQEAVAGPRGQHTYRFYAGHIDTVENGLGKDKGQQVRLFSRRATPVEFGGTNLLSADRVKQPQKGLYGALVIEPAGSVWADDVIAAPGAPELRAVVDNQGTGKAARKTRAQMTINAPAGKAGSGGVYDEAISVAFRIANLRWKDGTAIANIHQAELGREGAEDSGHAGYNYAAEPSWFRFQLPPDAPFGNAGCGALATPNECFGDIPNVHAFYANGLVADPVVNPFTIEQTTVDGSVISELGDPVTPVFRMQAGRPARMHVLNGASADRDAVHILHGHVWQRDPFVCPDDLYLGIEGLCSPGSIGSLALGRNPIGKAMGGEEGMGHVYGHWPILFNAGGADTVLGDYLFRDYAPSGARNGMFGIVRVLPDTDPAPTNDAGGGGAGGGGGGGGGKGGKKGGN